MGEMRPPEETVTFKWSATGTTSDAAQTEGYEYFNFLLPALVGTAISFLNAHVPEGPYKVLADHSGNPISIDASVDDRSKGMEGVDREVLASSSWLKLVSDASEVVGTEVSCSKQ